MRELVERLIKLRQIGQENEQLTQAQAMGQDLGSPSQIIPAVPSPKIRAMTSQ